MTVKTAASLREVYDRILSSPDLPEGMNLGEALQRPENLERMQKYSPDIVPVIPTVKVGPIVKVELAYKQDVKPKSLYLDR